MFRVMNFFLASNITWITRAVGAAILELTLLPMTTSRFTSGFLKLRAVAETHHKRAAPLLHTAQVFTMSGPEDAGGHACQSL